MWSGSLGSPFSSFVNAGTCEVSVPMIPNRKSAAVAQSTDQAAAANSTTVSFTRALYTGTRAPRMDLTTPLTYVKGIGPARAAMLEAKALFTVEDLLGYVPFRYEDRSNMKTIAQLAPGEMATVIAEVRSTKMSGFKRRSLGLFGA